MFTNVSRRKCFLVVFFVTILLLTSVTYPLSRFYQHNNTRAIRRFLIEQSYDKLEKPLLYEAVVQRDIPKQLHRSLFDVIKHKLNMLQTHLENVKMLKILQDRYYKFIDPRHVNKLLDARRNKEAILYSPIIRSYTHPKVVILVLSTVFKSQDRFLIRKTWASIRNIKFKNGKKIDLDWKIYFGVGARLNDLFDKTFRRGGVPSIERIATDPFLQEINFNRDMIVTYEQDNPGYMNDKLYSAMFWLNNKIHYDYLLVVNDSMFVNIPSLYKFIHSSHKPTTGLYAGDIKFSHKEPVTRHLNLTVFKPRYARGKTFIMSNDVAKKVVENYIEDKHASFDECFGNLVLKSGFDVWEEQRFLLDHCIYDANNIVTSIPDEMKYNCFQYLHNRTLPLSKNYPN